MSKKRFYDIDNGNNGGSNSLNLSGVLLVIFVVLKLIGVIDWPWIWVLSPLWISLAIVLIVLVIVMIIAGWETLKYGKLRKK